MVPRSISAGWFRRVAAVAAPTLSVGASGSAFAEGTVIALDSAYRSAQAGKLSLLDVRSAGEWGSSGFPKGAMTVSVHDREGARGFVRAALKAVNGNRTLSPAVISAHGIRSAIAMRLLRNAGFSKVYNVDEGVLGRNGAKGRFGRGLPVEHCVNCRNPVSVEREYVQ
jgi:rhodanese-related sulfurtransferase